MSIGKRLHLEKRKSAMPSMLGEDVAKISFQRRTRHSKTRKTHVYIPNTTAALKARKSHIFKQRPMFTLLDSASPTHKKISRTPRHTKQASNVQAKGFGARVDKLKHEPRSGPGNIVKKPPPAVAQRGRRKHTRCSSHKKTRPPQDEFEATKPEFSKSYQTNAAYRTTGGVGHKMGNSKPKLGAFGKTVPYLPKISKRK